MQELVLHNTYTSIPNKLWKSVIADFYSLLTLIDFFRIYLFLIGGQLLYNIVLVSAIHQHESAIGIHTFPHSWNSLPLPTLSHPFRLSQSTGLELISTSYLILHMAVYISTILSIHPPFSFTLSVHKSIYESLLLPWRYGSSVLIFVCFDTIFFMHLSPQLKVLFYWNTKTDSLIH